jgi:hypothetical protein
LILVVVVVVMMDGERSEDDVCLRVRTLLIGWPY